jgi:tricarboxylate carrier
MSDEKIDLSKPRYDQSTFLGRFKHFVNLTSPTLLLATQAKLDEAKKLLADKKAHVSENAEQLWKAKYLLESTFHPDTGEPVLWPFRLSSFVPMNLVIIAGMLTPNPTTASIVFWQWVNQSFNVGFNWANANKTVEMNAKETLVAYVTAVTTSVGVAVGLNRLIKNPVASRFVPFIAVGAAGVLNVFLMRRKELVDGITVLSPDGVAVGKSQAAGWSALTQVAISRVASSFPVLTIPPLIMFKLEMTPMLQRNPRLALLMNLGVITISMMTALPMAIAMFPQEGQIATKYLESQFQNLKDRQGRVIEYLKYNKGI